MLPGKSGFLTNFPGILAQVVIGPLVRKPLLLITRSGEQEYSYAYKKKSAEAVNLLKQP